MVRMMALLIATITAIALIGRMSPAEAERHEARVRSALPSLGLIESIHVPDFLSVFDGNADPVCRELDRAYVQLDAELFGEMTPGRVITVDDGTLAVLIVVLAVNGVCLERRATYAIPEYASMPTTGGSIVAHRTHRVRGFTRGLSQ